MIIEALLMLILGMSIKNTVDIAVIKKKINGYDFSGP